MDKDTKITSPYSVDVRVRIRKDDTVVYGTGISELLLKTDQLKSLNAAAKELGMPYRKALFIVTRAEEEFGKKILEKSIGGVGGGGSRLTEFGHYLVYQFHVMEEEVSTYARKLMNDYFPANNIQDDIAE